MQRLARKVTAHYSEGDLPHTLPWNRELLTHDEFKAWVASRQDAGAKIDIETCEIGCWYHTMDDPYFLGLGQEGYGDKSSFVRSPESRGWVCEFDLPIDKIHALLDRVKREYDREADDVDKRKLDDSVPF